MRLPGLLPSLGRDSTARRGATAACSSAALRLQAALFPKATERIAASIELAARWPSPRPRASRDVARRPPATSGSGAVHGPEWAGLRVRHRRPCPSLARPRAHRRQRALADSGLGSLRFPASGLRARPSRLGRREPSPTWSSRAAVRYAVRTASAGLVHDDDAKSTRARGRAPGPSHGGEPQPQWARWCSASRGGASPRGVRAR
jgi:hypothetical protein